jgi:hypothetical protein
VEEKGIVYAASGKKYIKEAKKSAKSVKQKMPDVSICLITNESKKYEEFDETVVLECEGKKIKQKIHKCPYKKAIFLDTDTYVSKDLNEVFEILNEFDLAANQISSGYHYKIDDLPNSFPEFNSGLIAFKNNEKVKNTIKEWNKQYEKMNSSWDQKSLRYVLYKSDLRIASLPIEYNFMIYYPAYVMAKVKVLHGRPFSKLVEVAEDMNRDLGHRVFIPRIGCLHRFDRMSVFEMARLIVKGTVMVGYEVLYRSYKCIQNLFG